MSARAVPTLLALVALLVAHAHAAVLSTSARQTEGGARVPPAFNINCGGPKIGNRFVADDFGWIVGTTSAFVKNDAIIGGAEEKNKPMYKSHRYSDGPAMWGYNIPVAVPGVYGCTVHFAETSSNAFKIGARVFDLEITAKGKPRMFKNIDVTKEVKKAQFTALTKTAENLVVTNMIKFRVTKSPKSKHAAFISGITCERSGDLPKGTDSEIPLEKPKKGDAGLAKLMPGVPQGPVLKGKEININAGFGKIGRFIAENSDWLAFGPTTDFFIKNQPIGGADPANAMSLWSHRYGQNGSDFGYILPVASSGLWDCTLHFAEIASGVKIGQRVFDVQLQDRVFTNVDVLAATKNAYFTSYVRTFYSVPIADSLQIQLKAKKGNPMLSSITCAQVSGLTAAAAKTILAARAKQIEVSPAPTITPSVVVPPAVPVVTPGAEPAEPVLPTATPTADRPAVPVPSPQQISDQPKDAPVPSPPVQELPQSTPGAAAPAPSPPLPPVSDERSKALLADLAVDSAPTATANQVAQTIKMTVRLPEGVQLDDALKNALKAVTAEGAKMNEVVWQLVKAVVSGQASAAARQLTFVQRMINFVTRAATTGETSLDVDMMAPLEKKTGKETVNALARYVQTGGASKKLQETYPGSDVSLRSQPNTEAYSVTTPRKGVKRSTLVAAIIGSLLGIIFIVAIIAFFVVNGRRNSEVNDPAGFEGAPPALESDAETQSTAAQSDANASVDYLDDDSTFTAATSRNGDPESGVTLDKDVWGRGSS